VKPEGSVIKKSLSYPFIILTFCIYTVQAFFFNVLGPSAAVMMAFYKITPAQQGFIFSMLSVGVLLSSGYFALHGERYNKFNVIAAAVLMLGVTGVVVGQAPPYAALALLIMVSGAGYTTIDVMVNGMIPELYPKQKNTLLPMVHAFFGTGAVLTPILVTTIVNPDVPSTFTKPFQLVGMLMFVFFIVFFIVSRRVIPETAYADMDTVRKRVSGSPAEILKKRKAWLYLGASMLYFSFLTGVVNWLPSYCGEIGMDFSASGAMLMTFFVGALIMRFCGPLILKKMAVRNAYLLFGLIAAAAVAAALCITSPAAMRILIFIGGFSQGSSLAFLILMCTGAFPERAASASSLIFCAAGAAGIVAPLSMGALAKVIGFRIPLLLGCALKTFSVLLIFLTEKR